MSLNFDHLATSAENWNGGREATSGLNDFAARKDCVRTSNRREPIAHLTKASSRRYLVVHSCPQKVRDSGIRKQEYLVSNYAGRRGRLLSKRMTPSKAVYDRLVSDVLKSEGKAKDEIRAEYRFDYARARSNRFADRMKNGAVAVILDPDVAAVFGSSGVIYRRNADTKRCSNHRRRQDSKSTINAELLQSLKSPQRKS